MLLEFRVKNFKSIRDEAVLSMNASKDTTFVESNTFETGIKSIPRVVRSAAIFGANASGKSNLLQALNYLRAMVIESASLKVEQTFNLKSFRLDSSMEEKPSEFELTFLKEGVRYQYGFAMTSERIFEEWLYVYKTAKPQHWFSRKFDQETQEDIFEFGPSLTGQRDIWKKSTRPNSLFLSMAAQLNSKKLTPIYSWIVNYLVIFGVQGLPTNDRTIAMIQDDDCKRNILNFLSSADIYIDDISIKSKEGMMHQFKLNALSGNPESNTAKTEILVPEFHHITSEGSAKFELNEESLGTQRLFALAGPILSILNEGRILVFDELDSSLHTLLARKLVELFHNEKLNKYGAQIIFSTHDTELLHNELLRRDQIWFVEKDLQQASNLYALTDFSPRKKEDLERGYLMGRYGAIPIFENLEIDMEKTNGA
jgi:AAA15 family ATPase/GTPase